MNKTRRMNRERAVRRVAAALDQLQRSTAAVDKNAAREMAREMVDDAIYQFSSNLSSRWYGAMDEDWVEKLGANYKETAKVAEKLALQALAKGERTL